MSQFKLTLVVVGILAVITLVGAVVFNPYRDRPDKEVAAIFEQDAKLGAARDRGSNDKSAARRVSEYVYALRKLDFSKTPEGFKEAFDEHIAAWENAITFLEKHDAERGEMHELFASIRAKDGRAKLELDKLEAKIFSTWREVEKFE